MPFIVLEGLDGAGKSTQVEKLSTLLGERGLTHRYVHFPMFDTPVYGDMIARFLRGEFGDAAAVDPHIVALLYAGDRLHAAPTIRRWLDEGIYVVADRYVVSNIAYQCAKVDDAAKRSELRRWIIEMEYDTNDIPRPDINIFLDVPFAFTESRLTSVREGADREYLNGGRDIHEASLDLQRRVREVYLEEARLNDAFFVADCSDEAGSMLSPERVFDKIYKLCTGIIPGSL